VKALQLKPSGADYEAMGALIMTGFIPTFAKSPKEDVGEAIIELLETRGPISAKKLRQDGSGRAATIHKASVSPEKRRSDIICSVISNR